MNMIFSEKQKELICLPLTSLPKPNTLSTGSDVEQLNDAAVVSKDVYAFFFGPKTANQKNYWCPNVVKISFGDRHIYRRLIVRSLNGLEVNRIGLTYNSIGELTNISNLGSNIDPKNDVVKISKGNTFAFWYRHPNPAARIAFLIGLWSIATSVIGVAASILLYVIDKLK